MQNHIKKNIQFVQLYIQSYLNNNFNIKLGE